MEKTEGTKYEYYYVDESAHWEATVVYKGEELWQEKNGKQSYSNEAEDKLILNFKGSPSELANIKSLVVSYESNTSKGEIKEEYTTPPTSSKFIVGGNSSNGAKWSEDETIIVHVMWNDVGETLELKAAK